jgi:GNAT superfamily N-acetyltransferase
MITLIQTNSEHDDFISLVKNLDHELAIRDGAEHGFYAQFNKIDKIKYVIIAYKDGAAVGCGSIKEYDADSMEVKRMYVNPELRSHGIATLILKALENWAEALGYKSCVLETGKKQPEAISLYTKNGYIIVPNYGQYQGIENSVCFQKNL